MARKRRRRNVRVASAYANPRLVLPSISAGFLDLGGLLRDVEDRRQFHPEQGARPARLISGVRHRLRAPRVRGPRLPIGVAFENPLRVLTCVRRKVRKEVLFAKRKVGRGAAKKMPRWSWRSNIQC